jgi:hypothetical protein
MEIFINPSRKELLYLNSAKEYSEFKGFIDRKNGDVYIWDSSDAVYHDDIVKQLNSNIKEISFVARMVDRSIIYIQCSGQQFKFTPDELKLLRNNKHLKKLAPTVDICNGLDLPFYRIS